MSTASPIGEAIYVVLRRFNEYLQQTETRAVRTRFPSSEVESFCCDLERIIDLLHQNTGLSLPKAKMMLPAMRVVASSLRGNHGVGAFRVLLESLRETVAEELQQQQVIEVLQGKGVLIQENINRLQDFIEDLIELDCLQTRPEWDSVLLGLPQSVCVRLVQLVVEKSTGAEIYIVHYTGDTAWQPVSAEGMRWILVGEGAHSEPDVLTDTLLLEQLVHEDPVAAEALFHDFFDPAVTALLTCRDDTLGAWPTAKIVGGVYTPAIAVSVMAPGCYSKKCGQLPATVTTALGRHVPILQRHPRHLTLYHNSIVDCGSGIGIDGQHDHCGSLAALVRRTSDDQTYLLTAEHVVDKLLDRRGALVRDLPMTLVIPSPQARKHALYNAVRGSISVAADKADADDENGKNCDVSLRLMNKILMHFDATGLSRALGQSPDAGPVTLKAVHEFIFEGHGTLEVDPAEVIRLTDPVPVAFDATRSVEISVDMALIPTRDGPCGASVIPLSQRLDFHLRAVVTLPQVLDIVLGRDEAAQTVTLYGAASSTSKGRLRNLIHIAHPESYSCSALNSQVDSAARRVLLGQYLVDSREFGRPGDSGGLVSVDFVVSKTVHCHALGVFVGTVDSPHQRAFVVSPLCALSPGYDVLLKRQAEKTRVTL